MTLRPLLLCIALATLALAPEALAQTANPLRLSVERAFGVGYSSFTASSTTMVGGTTVTRETTVTGIGVSLFGQGYNAITPAATLGALVPTQQLPRLALDYELGSHLTVGASAFLSYGSYTGADGDGASAFGFGLAPRVGYSLSLGDRLAFWPRVGVTFAYSSSSPLRASSGAVASSATSSYTTLALNLEPTLVYQLATNFGLTAGVAVDVPFVGTLTTSTTLTSGGSTTESTRDSTLTQLYFGLQLGVMGRF
jgi:hypothetical protein